MRIAMLSPPRGPLVRLLTGLAVAVDWFWSLGPSDTPTPPVAELKPTPGLPWFEDVTGKSGIDFQHFDSATDKHYIQETLGSGVAWIDYNNDGWPDLFCVQDGPVYPTPTQPSPRLGEGKGGGPTCKLYRNNGDGTFTDVTEAVGL